MEARRDILASLFDAEELPEGEDEIEEGKEGEGVLSNRSFPRLL